MAEDNSGWYCVLCLCGQVLVEGMLQGEAARNFLPMSNGVCAILFQDAGQVWAHQQQW